MKAIEAANLEKTYRGGVRALDGLGFAVEAGTIFGLLGPNGAGKSTTVKILTTLSRADAGEARVAGLDVVRDAEQVRRSIGVVGQKPGLDPDATGRENLEMQAEIYGVYGAERRRRVDDLLERVGLAAAADRLAKTYSGGMQRRLDVALGLVHRPQVLFLDEPTTGLDPLSRVTVWDEVRRLNRELGTTVFLTTQYLEEADHLAGRVAIIDEGRIVAEGTPRELKSEIGEPALTITLHDPEHREAAQAVLERFGRLLPSAARTVAVRLPEGAGALADVVRALDDAGVGVAELDLAEPTLDDVFLAKTGRHLEGEEAEAEPTEAAAR